LQEKKILWGINILEMEKYPAALLRRGAGFENLFFF
jgi:hypothetical protein